MSASQKNVRIETVVNKLEGIHDEFRFFDMEIVAGRPDTHVTVVGPPPLTTLAPIFFDADDGRRKSSNNCTFRFDFAKVYYNSRLSTEHSLVVSSLPSSSVVIDAFAGVGPFAVPLAKKGCGVYASDLNPSSVEALEDAVERNHVRGRCRTGCGDGREVMRRSVIELWHDPFPSVFPTPHKKNVWRGPRPGPPRPSPRPREPAPAETGPPRRLATHFIMNLPDTAIHFLDAFRAIYDPLSLAPGFMDALKGDDGGIEARMPIIICYCFTREDEGQPAMLDINAVRLFATSRPRGTDPGHQRASSALGFDVSPATVRDYELVFVRAVAPKKDYYRLVFRLPGHVAFSHHRHHELVSNGIATE